MDGKTQQHAEEQEQERAPTADLGWFLVGVWLTGPLGFLVLFLCGPTLIADSLLFFRARQVVRKQLVSSGVPIVAHIVHRRQVHVNGVPTSKCFVRFGYQMDNVSYVAKKEEQVNEKFYELTKSSNNNTVHWQIPSCYPASGRHPRKTDFEYHGKPDTSCSSCIRCFSGILLTAFVSFILGTIGGARTILGYFATAGGLLLLGILAAACLHYYWRQNMLYEYQVVDEICILLNDEKINQPLQENRIDDKDHQAGLEMGIIQAVQVDEDIKTLALTEESTTYASVRSFDETDLDIPISPQ